MECMKPCDELVSRMAGKNPDMWELATDEIRSFDVNNYWANPPGEHGTKTFRDLWNPADFNWGGLEFDPPLGSFCVLSFCRFVFSSYCVQFEPPR